MYLTAEQIADELGVNIQTIRTAFRDGSLPGRKLGHGWKTTRTALDEWLLAGNQTPTAPALPPLEHKDH